MYFPLEPYVIDFIDVIVTVTTVLVQNFKATLQLFKTKFKCISEEHTKLFWATVNEGYADLTKRRRAGFLQEGKSQRSGWKCLACWRVEPTQCVCSACQCKTGPLLHSCPSSEHPPPYWRWGEGRRREREKIDAERDTEGKKSEKGKGEEKIIVYIKIETDRKK